MSRNVVTRVPKKLSTETCSYAQYITIFYIRPNSLTNIVCYLVYLMDCGRLDLQRQLFFKQSSISCEKGRVSIEVYIFHPVCKSNSVVHGILPIANASFLFGIRLFSFLYASHVTPPPSKQTVEWDRSSLLTL